MSHFSGHVNSQAAAKPPTTRVAIMGVSLFAVGYLGFFSYLNRRHERKIGADSKNNDIATWESRMIQRNSPATHADNPATLRASRIQQRVIPLVPPATEHNARHRTVTSDRSNGILLGRPEQPTAQRDGSSGFVYTKRVNMKGEGVGEKKKTPSVNAEQISSTAENVKEKVADAAVGVKDKVSEVLGGGK